MTNNTYNNDDLTTNEQKHTENEYIQTNHPLY
jgi:hypothetical protein